MTRDAASKPTIRDRAADELKEFLVVAAYLFICFSALMFLKAAILKAHGIDFTPFGIAAVKALICAKFMSLGHMMHLGNLKGQENQPLIWPTLYRSFVFFLLLLLLNVLEEIIVGLIHHRSVADSISEITGGTLDQLIATSVIVILILIPFFAFRSLGEVLGERNLVRAFLKPRHSQSTA